MISNHTTLGGMGTPRFAGCIWLAAALALAPACATSPAAQDDGETGQLVLPLTQAGDHGELFRLTNAIFDITDLDGAVTTVDASGNENQLSVELPPGLFTVQLRDGWELDESTDGGATYSAVSALLGTTNPAGLRVLANQPVILQFGFLIRSVTGTLQITLGVVAKPRELAGGFVVSSATGQFADYALPGNTQLDFAIYFQLASLTSATLADGTKQHNYTAGTFAGVPGPTPLSDTPVAMEIYNDHVGLLGSVLSDADFGGQLTYTVAANPDGTFGFSGQYVNQATLTFGPSAIDAVLPSLDADGFPADVFFYDSGAPFTLTSLNGDTISGILRVRHLLPPP